MSLPAAAQSKASRLLTAKTMLALSTMWGKNRHQRLPDFAREARILGYGGLELHSSLKREQLDGIDAIGVIAVSSVHAPCPAPGKDTHLASLDKENRNTAVELVLATLELAEKVGAQVVVLHCGQVEGAAGLIEPLRHHWRLQGARGGHYLELKHRLQEQRQHSALPHLEALCRSLDILVPAAAARGLKLGLETRVHPHEIPSYDEMAGLLSAYDDQVLGYWHDSGHGEVQARLGFGDHYRWLHAFGHRLFGVHLHDVRGIDDHFAPGVGELDWGSFLALLPPAAIKVCEIGEWNQRAHVQASRGFLHEAGLPV